jgi:neutral ceramidase
MVNGEVLAGYSSASLARPSVLVGFGRNALACAGQRDPLMVQSLVLDDHQNRIAMVAFDLLAIDFAEADEIRRRAVALGFKPENVVISASHTHSGPPSINMGFVQKDGELAREVVDKAELVIREAILAMTRASITTGSAQFTESANRRQRTRLRRTVIGVNLNGPVDHEISYIAIEGEREKIIVLNFGCHPVINGTPFATADYIAGTREAMASAGYTATIFLCGALGDVDPCDREQRLSLKQKGLDAAFDFGRRIAQAVLTSLSNVSPEPNPRIALASATLETSLPRLAAREGEGNMQRELLVQGVRVANSFLVSFPGEIFAQSSLDLKSKFRGRSLSVISCANGYIGYVARSDEYKRGGYEIREAPRLFGFRVPMGLAEAFDDLAGKMIASL